MWTHVAITWDGTGLYSNSHIYKNGNALSLNTLSQNGVGLRISDASKSLNINDSDNPDISLFDDVRIYNRVLSETEITNLYNLGR